MSSTSATKVATKSVKKTIVTKKAVPKEIDPKLKRGMTKSASTSTTLTTSSDPLKKTSNTLTVDTAGSKTLKSSPSGDSNQKLVKKVVKSPSNSQPTTSPTANFSQNPVITVSPTNSEAVPPSMSDVLKKKVVKKVIVRSARKPVAVEKPVVSPSSSEFNVDQELEDVLYKLSRIEDFLKVQTQEKPEKKNEEENAEDFGPAVLLRSSQNISRVGKSAVTLSKLICNAINSAISPAEGKAPISNALLEALFLQLVNHGFSSDKDNKEKEKEKEKEKPKERESLANIKEREQKKEVDEREKVVSAAPAHKSLARSEKLLRTSASFSRQMVLPSLNLPSENPPERSLRPSQSFNKGAMAMNKLDFTKLSQPLVTPPVVVETSTNPAVKNSTPSAPPPPPTLVPKNGLLAPSNHNALMTEIQSPRNLKSSTLRRTANKRQWNTEGNVVKSLVDSDKVDTKPDRLQNLLQNRPSPADLISKNIMKDKMRETATASLEIMNEQKNKLRKALLKRPSVTELTEKKIIQNNEGNDSILHKETISYTKAIRSHLYGISLFVEANSLWCASGENLRVYDASTGKVQRMSSLHKTSGSIKCLSVIGHGVNQQVWVGSTDKKIYVYNGEKLELMKVLSGHKAAVKCLLDVGGGKVWSAASDGCVCIWEVASLTLVTQIQIHTRSINDMCLVDDTVWTASDDKTIRVTPINKLKVIQRLQGHTDYINSIRLVGNNRVYSASEDKSVAIWDTSSYKFLKRLTHNKAVKCVAGCGQMALTGSADGAVKAWKNKTYEFSHALEQHQYGVNSIFAQGSLVFCAFVDQTIMVFDMDKNKSINQFKLSETFSVDIVFKEETQSDQMDDEMIPVMQYLNARMKLEEGSKHLVPFDPNSIKSSVKALKDGVLLCQLVASEMPGLIDSRVINVKPKSQKDVISNLNILLNSAAVLGVDVSHITSADFLNEKYDSMFDFTWQIVEGCLFANLATRIKHEPEYAVLLESGETARDLSRLPAEEILLRWFNYHLKQGGSRLICTNFSNDIQNSECYQVLLQQLVVRPVSYFPEDEEKSAAKVLEAALEINCGRYVSISDIVEGHNLMNIAFITELFKKCSGLKAKETKEPVAAVSPLKEVGNNNNSNNKKRSSQMIPEQKTKFKFDAAERDQKSMSSWLNSFGFDPMISDLFEDLKDGIILLKTIERVSPGSVDWRKVNQQPDNTWKRCENCNQVVTLAQNIGLNLKGIAGKDIEAGNQNLTMALLWQLMRSDILNFVQNLQQEDGKQITEPMMIEWANKMVRNAGRNSSIESFRDPVIQNGVFLIELLASIDESTINFELVEAGETPEECVRNAQYLISSAWRAGISMFVLWEDIVEVKSNMILVFVAALMMFSSNNPTR